MHRQSTRFARISLLLSLGVLFCVSNAAPRENALSLAQPKENAPFFFFGMGNRDKFLYREGKLIDPRTGTVLREWNEKEAVVSPAEYTVRLGTEDSPVTLVEDEEAFWIEENGQRTAVTKGSIRLPSFEGNPHQWYLRVLLHEILVNIVDSKPLPNYLVYSKPWYRDGAMVAMCLKETGNLDLIKPWILSLDDPFDRNNAGNREADNLGQVLYLISLVSDKSHPLVEKVLRLVPEFQKEKYIIGTSDFTEHPVYQTKWLKFGLRALGLEDPYEIPNVYDSYSALFWMDFKDRHVEGKMFSPKDIEYYPYLGWAEAHFHGGEPPLPLERTYPLTWETNASQADYNGMAQVSQKYVDEKKCAPHTWHAAEMFLYLLEEAGARR